MAIFNKRATDSSNTGLGDIQRIINNLNNILNTKRGYGYFLENFGISDYNHLSSRTDIAKMIIEEVTENIERFEPRVKLIRIIDLDSGDMFHLSFQIDCVILHNARSLQLILDPVKKRYQVNS
jgi:type VI secretion system protein